MFSNVNDCKLRARLMHRKYYDEYVLNDPIEPARPLLLSFEFIVQYFLLLSTFASDIGALQLIVS